MAMVHRKKSGASFGRLKATSGDVNAVVKPGGFFSTLGGFPSVTLAGVLLVRQTLFLHLLFEAHTLSPCFPLQTEGQWYYEIEIIRGTGIGQLGWADLDFIGAARGGRGIGDDLHSWGWDGARVLMWSNQSYRWGAKWHVRD